MKPGNIKLITKSIFISVLVLGFACMLALFSINEYVKSSANSRIISVQEASELKADCILILGAGVKNDGKPSDMLHDRLTQGVELYKLGASDKLLVSGDHGRVDYDEVNVMKKFAIDQGIKSENIFMDHAGFSTYESLYRTRDIFKAKKIIIVTQKYHLYRAIYIANKLGLDAYGIPSDPRIYAGQSYREIREILARSKDFFNVIVKPKPTYLGKAIPVSGNGDLTND